VFAGVRFSSSSRDRAACSSLGLPYCAAIFDISLPSAVSITSRA
jgi:hypothetical protein